MAYMNQDRKATIAAALKKVVPAGWKYTLGVNNHSTIVFTLRQAPVDILGHIRENIGMKASYGQPPQEVGTYWAVNEYYLDTQFSGDLLTTMQAIKDALNDGNWDKSDIQSDYFNVGWYVNISIGRWNDPFLDTVPLATRPTKTIGTTQKAGKTKVPFDVLSPYLPAGWAAMTPGKKAAATKKAMIMAGV